MRRRDKKNATRWSEQEKERKKHLVSGSVAWIWGVEWQHTQHTPTHTHTNRRTQFVSDPSFIALKFFKLFNRLCVVIVSMNHYCTNYQLLINYWLISSLLAVLLFRLTVLTRLRCWKSVVREGKNVLSHQKTICLMQRSTTYSAFSLWNTQQGCRGFPLWKESSSNNLQ